MVKEHYTLKMAIFIKDRGKTINIKDKAYINGKTETIMKENGKIILGIYKYN